MKKPENLLEKSWNFVSPEQWKASLYFQKTFGSVYFSGEQFLQDIETENTSEIGKRFNKSARHVASR